MPNTERSPIGTRSRTPIQQPTTETDALQAILEELRQQREERIHFEAAMEARLQERDERWEQRLNQLSPFNYTNNPIMPAAGMRADTNTGLCAERNPNTNTNVNIRLKPDTFDGAVPFSEFMAQFSLIARANAWDDTNQAIALAACLRGKARSVLDTSESGEIFGFAELKEKLELRFGERGSAHNYYIQFTNRRQANGEDYATLGADLERLCRRAYPGCTVDVCERIACSQFIIALSDKFVKRTLQLEGVATLKTAIERARTVKTINEQSFTGTRNENNVLITERRKDDRHGVDGFNGKGTRKVEIPPKKGECWQCGGEGHFRAECPTLKAKEMKEN